MLSNLLAKMQHTTHAAVDRVQNIDMIANMFNPANDLNEGDSAQWAAGLLFATSKQTIDARDYLVGCSTWNTRLDQKLERAYE